MSSPRGPEGGPLHIALSGAGGLVGTAVTARLSAAGHRIGRITRGRSPEAGGIRWDPLSGEIDETALGNVDAVVHLAGENIGAGRWSAERKRRIRDSRVAGTRGIAAALSRLPRRPRTLVAASAIGYYGDRGDEALDEDSPPGTGFLADVCREWEAATAPAEEAGVRVVRLRIGVVLSGRGGALPRMALPFRFFVGGRVGHGRQYVSWIALDDLTAVVERALLDSRLGGPVNAVAPQAVRQAELARTLGRVLGRPSWLPLPAWAVRLALGEMGRELLLSGARVVPRRLEAVGFRFAHDTLDAALQHALRPPRRGVVSRF